MEKVKEPPAMSTAEGIGWEEWEDTGDRVSLDGLEIDPKLGCRVHPFAEAFPMMEGTEFDELVEDIRTNGLRVPIEYIDHNGERIIVDGRNRLKACLAAGVEPKLHWTPLYSDEEVLGFIWSKNVHRRQLTASMRAIIATEHRSFIDKIAEAKDRARRACLKRGAEAQEPRAGNVASTGKSTADIVSMMAHVSPRTMKDAFAVQRSGDEELIQQVKAGEKSVSAAAKEVRGMGRLLEMADYTVRPRTVEPHPEAFAMRCVETYSRSWCLGVAKTIVALLSLEDNK